MMTSENFNLKYTENAEDDLNALIADKSKKGILKAVVKSLKLMEANLKHPSLNTHKYIDLVRYKISEATQGVRHDPSPICVIL